MSPNDILSGKSISKCVLGEIQQEFKVMGAELWQIAVHIVKSKL